MLNIISGGFYSSAEAEIIRQIAERCSEHKHSYLIVPEQQTMVAESELADAAPRFAPLYCEAMNFTRFANTVERCLGGLAGKSADSLHRALIIYRAITELRDKLHSVGKTGNITSGTVNKAIGAIRKTESFGLSAKDMLSVAERMRATKENQRLADKLEDLALIATVYKDILKEKYNNAEDHTVKTAGKLRAEGEKMLNGYHIFIKGFTSFTEPQYELISVLTSLCDVTIELTFPKEDKEAFEYTELRSTQRRLTRMASAKGVEVRIKSFPDEENIAPKSLKYIADNIWRSNPENDNKDLRITDEIRIMLADDPYDECDFVASDIKRKIMAGAHYSDFAVIARDINDYDGIVDGAFADAKIPLYISKGESLSGYELIRLIDASYRVLQSGFSYESVISFAKCSLSGISPSDADELELYAERWQISGKRFTDGEVWNMNPDGFSSRRKDGTDEKLLRINATKDKLIKPLMRFCEDSSGEHTARELATSLVELLLGLRAEEYLAKRAEELLRLSCYTESKITAKIYSLVMDALDAVVDIMGDKTVSAAVFSSLISLAFSEVSIGSIPAFLDQASAGSADTIRIPKKKHIYLIGVAAARFPKRISDDGFFDDGEIERLRAEGLPIEPEQSRRSAMEYYYLHRALSLATESVTLLCPLRDDSLTPLRQSEAIDRIRAITADKVKPVRLKDIPLLERTYYPEYALKNLAGNNPDAQVMRQILDRCGYESKTVLLDKPIRRDFVYLKEQTRNELYPKDIALTQTRFETYSSCPMRYFCQYNLRLDGGERAEWGSNHIGTFIHAVLENFFKILRDGKRTAGELTEGEIDELTKKAAEKYTAECFSDLSLRTERMNLLIKRLSRYANPIVRSLCDEFAGSRYQPVFFELAIEKGSEDSPAPASFKLDNGRSAYIYGTIDRVDSYVSDGKIYLRVVDYKTGSKTFSPKDLERGENLQMFLYLKALTESDGAGLKERLGGSADSRLVPAGVMYVKADVSDVTVDSAKDSAEELIKANQARVGMFLDDADSLAAMNPDFLPLKYKKDGTLTQQAKDLLYDEARWDELNKTIANAVEGISRDMLSGKISAEPMKRGGTGRACENCSFKPICRNSKAF